MTEKEMIKTLAKESNTTGIWLNENFGFSILELSEATSEKEFSQVADTMCEIIQHRMARLFRLQKAVQKLNYEAKA